MAIGNKTIAYALMGFGVIVIGYFIYKNALTKGAQEAISGGVSGFGGMSKTLIGDTLGMAPTQSKAEAQTQISAMKAAASPIPAHSPHTPKLGTTPLAKTVSQKMSTASTPTSTDVGTQRRTTSAHRSPITAQRPMARGNVNPFQAMRDTIASRHAARRSRTRPSVRSGGRSSASRYSGRRARVGRGMYVR